MFLSRFVFLIATVIVSVSPAFASQGDDNNGATNKAQVAEASVSSSSKKIQKINLNEATVEALLTVDGLNVRKAKSIIAYRKQYGPFKSLDLLAKVRGFKRMKPDELKKITDQLTTA